MKESLKSAAMMMLPVGRRAKHFQRLIYNVKVMLLCGFVTILVVRGTIRAGSSGSPTHTSTDTQELRRPTKQLRDVRHPNMKALKQEDDPTETEEDLDERHILGPKISDWNEQRSIWLNNNPHIPAIINGKPRILLVTGSQPKACGNPWGDYYNLKFIKNKIDYCRLHGIEIFYSMAVLNEKMDGYWIKLPLIRKFMLAHPELEWIWWMDSDAIFTDMVFELPLEKYKDFNFILHGWDELVYNRRNWIGLNAGSFLLRNCQWSLDLMDTWAAMGPKGRIRTEFGKILFKSLQGRPEFESDDQSALVYLLATRKDEWSDKIFLENSYYLHGYWVILVEKYEEMMEKHHPGLGDDRWPFVTHFVGCKTCAKYGSSYPVEKCLKHMERAFNFADNQILQMFGFQHKSLGTFKVKRTRNDSVLPLENKENLHLHHSSFKTSAI